MKGQRRQNSVIYNICLYTGGKWKGTRIDVQNVSPLFPLKF